MNGHEWLFDILYSPLVGVEDGRLGVDVLNLTRELFQLDVTYLRVFEVGPNAWLSFFSGLSR